jgi:exopolysaccharide production protein ExoZ
LAAILVVAHHSFKAVDSRLFGLNVSYMFEFGAVGVHLFFIISGFIMVYTQERNFGAAHPVQFLWRRIDRIYPIYWFCAFLTAIAYYLLGRGIHQDSVWDWFGSLLLFPGYSSNIIFVGWTLTYEMYFYLAFTLILALNLSIVRSLLLLTVVFIFSVSMGIGISDIKEDGFLSVLTSILLMEFVLGSWIAYLFIHLGSSRLIGGITLFIGIFLFAMWYLYGYDDVPRTVSWGMPSAFIVLSLVLLEKGEINGILGQLVKTLGDASYALYLIHPMIISILVFGLPNGDIEPVGFFVFLMCSMFFSTIFAVLIDKFIQPKLRFRTS